MIGVVSSGDVMIKKPLGILRAERRLPDGGAVDVHLRVRPQALNVPTDRHRVSSEWLRKAKGGLLGDRIKWNFTKFLIGPDGSVVERYASVTKPEKLKDDIERILKQA